MTAPKTMTTAQAKAQAKAIFGAKGYVKADPGAADEAAKANIRAEFEQARAALSACDKADKVAYADLRRRFCNLSGKLLCYRASVGFLADVGGISFFHVQGQGDTFLEAFEQVELQRAAEKGAVS